MRLLILSFVLCLSLFAQQQHDASGKLEERVKSRINTFPGKVTLYAKNLDSGQSYGILPGDPVRTASTIKLAIMAECFAEAAEGKLKFTEPITL